MQNTVRREKISAVQYFCLIVRNKATCPFLPIVIQKHKWVNLSFLSPKSWEFLGIIVFNLVY